MRSSGMAIAAKHARYTLYNTVSNLVATPTGNPPVDRSDVWRPTPRRAVGRT